MHYTALVLIFSYMMYPRPYMKRYIFFKAVVLIFSYTTTVVYCADETGLIIFTPAESTGVLMMQPASSVAVNPIHGETDSPLCWDISTIFAHKSSPLLFFTACLSLLCSQQDMKDEEITDREGKKPKADTIGEIAISTARTCKSLVIHDVSGNLFSCSHLSTCLGHYCSHK